MKTIIIEDKDNSRLYLESLIEEYNELDYLGYAETVKEGVSLISSIKPELVFFDVELPDGDSFDILRQLDKQDFKVVFISSYDSYAIKAFQFNAIDYLLKPLEKEAFSKAVLKVLSQNRIETQEDQLKQLLYNVTFPKEKLKKIVLNTTEYVHLVEVKDIIRLESEDNYSYFYLVDGRRLIVSNRLKMYEALLVEYGFFRIHQSHLINMEHLINYNKKTANVSMVGDTKLPVSVRKQPVFMKLIKSLK